MKLSILRTLFILLFLPFYLFGVPFVALCIVLPLTPYLHGFLLFLLFIPVMFIVERCAQSLIKLIGPPIFKRLP
jgi:hypothetical protein